MPVEYDIREIDESLYLELLQYATSKFEENWDFKWLYKLIDKYKLFWNLFKELQLKLTINYFFFLKLVF